MRKRTREARFDFRGGLNREFSKDVLSANELVQTQNVRLGTFGALTKRTGSQRLHANTLASGADVTAVHLWDSPGGAQIVAVAGGKLHHRLVAGGPEFTVINSPTLSNSNRIAFAEHREGAAILLYIADGITIHEFDGTNLAAVSGAPAATDIAQYKLRMFAIDGSKTLYASAVSDPDEWNVGNGAIEADVETFDTEGLVRIIPAGSSLLLCKRNNIARFTGVDATDISIDTETEGVSPEVGVLDPGSCIAFENVVFFRSDRGCFIASEGGTQAIAEKVETLIDGLGTTKAVHHRGRREIWLADDSEMYVYNYRVQSWTGPWDIPSTSLARLELASGAETVMRGGTDGFVRQEDTGALDDVLYAGTGGTAISMIVELPPIHFGVPHIRKSMYRLEQHAEAEVSLGGLLTWGWDSEMGSGDTFARSKGSGLRDYSFRPRARGKRITFTLTEESAETTSIAGLILAAALGRMTA